MSRRRVDHQRVLVATELLRAGMSSPIVAVEVGVPEAAVKRLRATLGLGAPRRGVMRETRSLLSTDRGRTETALLATVYRSLGGATVADAIQRDTLLAAYQAYTTLRREAGMTDRGTLTLDEAWTLARDIRSGIVRWRRCRPPCGTVYVLVWDQMAMNIDCPVCAVERRHGFAGAGVALGRIRPSRRSHEVKAFA